MKRNAFPTTVLHETNGAKVGLHKLYTAAGDDSLVLQTDWALLSFRVTKLFSQIPITPQGLFMRITNTIRCFLQLFDRIEDCTHWSRKIVQSSYGFHGELRVMADSFWPYMKRENKNSTRRLQC